MYWFLRDKKRENKRTGRMLEARTSLREFQRPALTSSDRGPTSYLDAPVWFVPLPSIPRYRREVIDNKINKHKVGRFMVSTRTRDAPDPPSVQPTCENTS